MVNDRDLSRMVQWNLAYERLLRAFVPRERIPVILQEMGMEHIRDINQAAADPKDCPNCSNEFHPNVLEDTRLDGKNTIVCQGCRSKLWLMIDEGHYGTVPVVTPPKKGSWQG